MSSWIEDAADSGLGSGWRHDPWTWILCGSRRRSCYRGPCQMRLSSIGLLFKRQISFAFLSVCEVNEKETEVLIGDKIFFCSK